MMIGEKQEEATLYCKKYGMSVLAGSPFFEAIFKHLGCEVEWLVDEGQELNLDSNERMKVAKVSGPSRKILVGERTSLNLLSRASGIATLARKAHKLAEQHKFKVYSPLHLSEISLL